MKPGSHAPHLLIVLSLVIAFSLSTSLTIRRLETEDGDPDKSLLVLLLGDSRRLFANHVFIKADEYFHAGYYPSIFDQAAMDRKGGGSAVATGAATGDAHAGEVEWMHEPKDWIERFSRNFFPSEHRHLDAADHDHDGDGVQDHAAAAHPEHDHDGDGVADHAAADHVGHDHGPGDRAETGSAMREILPWLRIAAELDPNREETYVTGAYWLRKRLDRVDEAEAFIREGLRANPKSCALTFELARIHDENRQNPPKARNLYHLALRYWNESQRLAPEPDTFLLSQILAHLATLERREGNTERALEWLRELKKYSPNPAGIDQLIRDTEAGVPLPE
jgi:tetratricopeptide (TPR) repeat protein